jgi:hypothetical protein
MGIAGLHLALLTLGRSIWGTLSASQGRLDRRSDHILCPVASLSDTKGRKIVNNLSWRDDVQAVEGRHQGHRSAIDGVCRPASINEGVPNEVESTEIR